MTVYGDHAVVEGVPILFKSSVRSWEGWPDDVRDTLRHWNRQRRLSFGNDSFWGGLATGFAAFTLKCVRCDGFFNSSGSTACRLDERWYCDDCVIDLARDEVALPEGAPAEGQT